MFAGLLPLFGHAIMSRWFATWEQHTTCVRSLFPCSELAPPSESAVVRNHVSRWRNLSVQTGENSHRFPSEFMLMAAVNPCPCRHQLHTT